ncbi:hypothetical protein Mal64_19760 [Pseudobythopirellula maris]|uniref:Response regulatory domain-containing protein n=1 Tax=Pseudobythopirellula maris TaxID=2527991 RepID=A0A5C5ZQD0_9BACT|nr:hypothetical protein [Pseudobythopirellula maris]TWT88493.1 hypothetical protein Mal64_19760 [Pseudobythopirellula maris]
MPATLVTPPNETTPVEAPAARAGRLRVLFVTTPQRPGDWLAEAFASEGAGNVGVEQAVGVTSAVGRLRDRPFDAVLATHQPGELDASELSRAIRAIGCLAPVVVLGDASPAEAEADLCAAGADAYCWVAQTTPRTLLWAMSRAIESRRLRRENQQLRQAERRRLALEHSEADRLLAEQRQLIDSLEMLGQPSVVECEANDPIATNGDLDPRLVERYRELLRAYAIMGSSGMADEMADLAERFAGLGLSPRRAVALHLGVLEEMVAGLGSRSARHVMGRADLLALDLTVHLAEAYRGRYLDRTHPPRQLPLPGFDAGDLPPDPPPTPADAHGYAPL